MDREERKPYTGALVEDQVPDDGKWETETHISKCRPKEHEKAISGINSTNSAGAYRHGTLTVERFRASIVAVSSNASVPSDRK